MSWRMYLARVDKEKASKLRVLPPKHYMQSGTEEDEDCDIDNTAFYQIINTVDKKDEYCIGLLPISATIGAPFYETPETQELFKEYNPRVISKEDFQSIIDLMRKAIADYYRGLLTGHRANPEYWQKVLEDKLDTWEAPYITPYNLKDDSKFMVNSFDAEYQIWDMVRLYKSINWTTDAVVFYGW